MWKQCEALSETIISCRRSLHRIPELGHDLPLTQAYLRETLEGWGIPYTLSAADSSLWGEITGGAPGKTVLLRADIDALPVQEETGLPFASRHPGRMHACGHDAHGAMLLGALKVLQDNRAALRGKARFVFQAAEERVSGAKVAVEQGVARGVDAVFGCHIGSLAGASGPAGTFYVVPGNVMASADTFYLTVTGKGCHGSTPEMGVDPITIAAHIVINLQEILAREIPAVQPAALTIGRIRGGEIFNIIPETAELEGTLRTHDPAVRKFVLKRLEEVAQATAALFRGSCEVAIRGGTGAVINDPALTALAQEAIRKVAGDAFLQTALTPIMGSEDFSVYQQEVPGVFYFLSSVAGQRTGYPHHNPRFDVDESVLWKGSAAFVSLAETFLNGWFSLSNQWLGGNSPFGWAIPTPGRCSGAFFGGRLVPSKERSVQPWKLP